ncbi:hypothetical protein E6P09_01815 [Haloferax mediterranei ATCC 33500]|uniref:Nudix hydrolase domain-containing protein n=1 Tax=Haloferax mediterranei (strain ATCC 33500 / DSM 1411 / JCM 8866 / NBRC 14739 / NCIMB 2177 / R-4) TaxID=523841 RepID=M0IW34_HALMT|nr:hypothetical protein [Haloferax mediterranei]AHZ23057.1 hypothetical protein BM92_10605 [Haloferax mediterranei ATCC 33500]ELZ99988.1 hypothetical protein C439_11653 [Haloferax mediterranei ATCC 33500]MDX5987590.1 hypothetical protein [Haloferax mediterranei ATCC 33500]QCQ74078.1 hypothetical protein E6P09_01815 [Haloferax mediterranei ATCC 33500]
MVTLEDPEQLRDRENIAFHEETHIVGHEEFESCRDDLDSHVAVGVTNDASEVLLMDDGSHGWTLTAFPAEPGDDWVATAREGVQSLIGVPVELDCPERVRRIDFQKEGTDQQTTIYNVVCRAVPVEGCPVASNPELDGEALQDLRWFDEIPTECEGPIVEDIRLFVE